MEPIIDKDAIYLAPGIYRPSIDMYVPHDRYIASEEDMLMKGEHFLVSKHVQKIGSQRPYQYYSIKRLGFSLHHLIKSYETKRWNTVAQILTRVGEGF
jgi:hypothetical protein